MKDAKYAAKHAAYIIAPVWSCFIDAFGYGTAAPMQALISALKLLYERIQKGAVVDLYYPAETQKQVINSRTFDEIIKKYFSDFLLKEIKR